MLTAVNNILLSNWGSQNFCQILVFTDCGIGFGSTSLANAIASIKMSKTKKDPSQGLILPFSYTSKLSFICLGSTEDQYFQTAVKMYQELLDVSGQKGFLFIPKRKSDVDYVKKEEKTTVTSPLSVQSINDLVAKMCETNFKQFEAVLKCGGYFKLESLINIWPAPLPYTNKETDVTSMISRKLEICGFVSLSDIGSPMSISRHLILPKMDQVNKKFSKSEAVNEYEKLEADIKMFYSKSDGANSDEESPPCQANELAKESVCVLLHGALKVENMAALILLNENWFGFIYSYADSKKKSNLMLTVLPPGHDVIPWLGDLRYVGNIEDTQQDNSVFPVKPIDKRSYSQNCVVWIKQAGLQSDIQKVLRHAKKLPEKTQNFYKELNRIRRAALSLGFVELLDGLSSLFEREIALLPSNASPDCALQLKHTAMELRKLTNRDLKTMITALPSKYNQL
ncbi:hypothetical protein HA402_001737 [Bradysia odoriphaga]|nr:hypothetical protein HA402_001737 [Bradysia odoriphaga]